MDNADLNPTATAPDVIVGQSCEVQYSTGPGTTWYPGEVTALSDKDVSIKWDESGKTDDLPIAITRNQKKFKIVHAPVSNAAMDIQAAAIDESKEPNRDRRGPFSSPLVEHRDCAVLGCRNHADFRVATGELRTCKLQIRIEESTRGWVCPDHAITVVHERAHTAICQATSLQKAKKRDFIRNMLMVSGAHPSQKKRATCPGEQEPQMNFVWSIAISKKKTKRKCERSGNRRGCMTSGVAFLWF